MERTSSMFVIIKEAIGEMELNKDETNFSEEIIWCGGIYEKDKTRHKE